MERLEFLEGQCIPLECEIRKAAKKSDDVKLLLTIPGADFYLASLISSYIRDVNRFLTFDHLASYLGIIPESRDSADVKRRGRMTKDGPPIARWALGVMTDTVMQRKTHQGVLHGSEGAHEEWEVRPRTNDEEACEDGLLHAEEAATLEVGGRELNPEEALQT